MEGSQFKELLERIRDIRAPEKVFYCQVLVIYTTSVDYDPKAEYKRYKAKTLSSVEEDYLDSIKMLEQKSKK